MNYWNKIGGARGKYKPLQLSSHSELHEIVSTIKVLPQFKNKKSKKRTRNKGAESMECVHFINQHNEEYPDECAEIEIDDLEHDAILLFACIIHQLCCWCSNHEETKKNDKQKMLEFDFTKNETEYNKAKGKLRKKLRKQNLSEKEIQQEFKKRFIVRMYCSKCGAMEHEECKEIIQTKKVGDEYNYDYPPAPDNLPLGQRFSNKHIPNDDRKIFWRLYICAPCKDGIFFVYFLYIFYIFLTCFLYIF